MMKNVKFVLVLLIGLWITGTTTAQDAHFSQFYNTPLWLNPALTGVMNHDMRFIANYRNQWATIGEPFQTAALSVDANILAGFSEDDFFGVGLFIMNDMAGDSEFRDLQAQLSASYSKSLGPDQNIYISFGGKIGFGQRRLNLAALTFDSQFNGDVLDPFLPSGELINGGNVSYLDASAGLSFFIVPTEGSSVLFGGSISHLNEPEVGFLEGGTDKLFRRYSAHISAEVPASDQFTLIPQAIMLAQGPTVQVNMGLLARYHFGERDEPWTAAVTFGTTHRFNDAQVVLLRYDYGPLGISASYDVNISTLNEATNGVGGPEIALIYTLDSWQKTKREKNGRIHCPGLY
ncbi:MAG: PorP/SprF family type IX secretion system membrane protein [Bacteroidota bacterium]